jgi:AcrR family transcriptional regulator
VRNVPAGHAGCNLCTPIGTRLGYAGRVAELEKGPQGLRRGRGARERILSASQQLFRDQGINRTGVDQLCAVAEVSKHTLYRHFTGKDELIAECLRRFDPDILPEVFDRTDLTPRARLLAAFDVHAPLCPFIAAAVEIPDPDHPARVYARDYKKAFAARLTNTAREAGATNPEQLGEQLALLLDGASARSRVLNTETLPAAAAIAAFLVDNAIPTAAALPTDASAVEQHGQDDDDDDAGRGGAPPSGRGAVAEQRSSTARRPAAP